jgi:hypothetical protein
MIQIHIEDSMTEISKEALQAIIEKNRKPASAALMADFTKVAKILGEVQALIQEDKLHDAVGRIGDALAAAQLALDIDHIRGQEQLDPSAKVALVQRGETHIQHLTDGALPEVAVTAQHYRHSKAFDLYK